MQRHSRRWSFLPVVAALALASCQCGEDPVQPPVRDGGGGNADAGPTDGGAVDGGGNPDAGECTLKANGETCAQDNECCSSACDPTTNTCVSGTGTCVVVGDTCQSNVECCGGKTCEADATGVKRCTENGFCKGSGETCAQASECCSLSCNGTCQTTGGLCTPAGGACTQNTACCSNDCNGTTCVAAGTGCSTLGEVCTQEGFDPTCCSQFCVNYGADGGSDLRCARSSSCAARGEICATATDCCSGVCKAGGTCPSQAELGQKRFVGEPCVQDADCSSYACASSYPGGPKTCQFLGGCRPAEEICTDDWQCCGYLELSASRNSCQTAQPVPGACSPVGTTGVKTCALQPTDKEVGEICESGGMKVHNCCGGADACRPTVTGVSRCLYGGGFTADGGCTANGEDCSIADQCCSNICAPATLEDGGVVLRCSGCIAEGAACTTNNDCCSTVCTNGVCEVPVEDAGTLCRPLGGACTSGAQCCSQICSATDGGSGTCLSSGIN